MKTKKGWFIASLILLLLGAGYGLSRSSYGTLQNADGLVLEVKSDNKTYLPGEIILLNFSVINKSAKSVSLYKGSTVQDGNLKVLIAYNNGPFKEYFGPGWGTKDADYEEAIKLAPDQSFETEATVLWNQKNETAHLNQLYAKKLIRGRINTEYALPEPGTYQIKAILFNPLSGKTIESYPIIIIIEEPQGEDIEAWSKIKDDGKYALFLQTGGLIEHPKGRKTLDVINTLESILSLHPNSHYAESIRSGLNKHRSILESSERKNLDNSNN